MVRPREAFTDVERACALFNRTVPGLTVSCTPASGANVTVTVAGVPPSAGINVSVALHVPQFEFPIWKERVSGALKLFELIAFSHAGLPSILYSTRPSRDAVMLTLRTSPPLK